MGSSKVQRLKITRIEQQSEVEIPDRLNSAKATEEVKSIVQIQQDLTGPLPPMRGSDDYVDPQHRRSGFSPTPTREAQQSSPHESGKSFGASSSRLAGASICRYRCLRCRLDRSDLHARWSRKLTSSKRGRRHKALESY